MIPLSTNPKDRTSLYTTSADELCFNSVLNVAEDKLSNMFIAETWKRGNS